MASSRRTASRSLGWGVALAALGAVLALAAWVTRSSVFDARSIVVRGTSHLTPSQVLDLAGVHQGSNLVWFSPGRVEGRLEANPWIASANVSRSLPSTLKISIHERTAVAVVQADRLLLVAADRTVLGPTDSASGLPRIESPRGPIAVGSLLPLPTPGLVILGPMTSSLRSQVRAVMVADGGVLLVELRSGAQALFGDASEADAKAAALQAVLRWAANHGVVPERIDLRVPSRPALLPQGTVVPTG